MTVKQLVSSWSHLWGLISSVLSDHNKQKSAANKGCPLLINGFPASAVGLLYSSESTKKAHLFRFVKMFHFPPRLSISRCLNFIKISFPGAKCWLYVALREGSCSLCNVWSLLRHFFSTENSLENHRKESKIILVLEDRTQAHEQFVQIFWCYNLKTNNTAIRITANIWIVTSYWNWIGLSKGLYLF